MKVLVDDEEVFKLEEWEKKVICNDIPKHILEEDCKRRLEWVLKHKAEQCYNRFEKEWMEKLRKDPTIVSIPTDKKAFVEMVCCRPDYQCRATRDALEQTESEKLG
jgi:hypothetical protein